MMHRWEFGNTEERELAREICEKINELNVLVVKAANQHCIEVKIERFANNLQYNVVMTQTRMIIPD